MPNSFPLVTLASDNFFPGSYVAVNLSAGGNTSAGAPINVLLLGNAAASSTCVSQSLFDGYIFGPGQTGQLNINNLSDVLNMFGARSELHLAYLEFVATNPGVPVFFVAVKESTGSAATGSVTFTTTAAAAGTAVVYLGDNIINVGINSGDTASTIATNVSNAVNSKNTIPATASPSGGTVTFTAANKGPRGNYIRYAVQVVGAGVTTTSSAQNFAYFTGGTVEDSWTNALATIQPKKFRYIVAAGEDATTSGNLGSLVAQVNTDALPIPGIRQRVVAGVVGSVGTANAFAKNLNNPRADVIWQQNANKTPFQLAAQLAAGITLGENQTVPQLNYDFLGSLPSNQAYFKCSKPFDGSTPSRSDLTSALASGVTPVSNGASGAFVVSAVTSYSQDAFGNLDTRIRDHHIVTVCDYIADQIQSMWSTSFAGKLAADDPPKGQSLPNSNVVTPSALKVAINKILFDAASNGPISQADLPNLQKLTQVIRDAYVDSRFDVMVNVKPISLAHQLAVNLNQLSVLQ